LTHARAERTQVLLFISDLLWHGTGED